MLSPVSFLRHDRGALRPWMLAAALLCFGAKNSNSATLHFDGAPGIYPSGHRIRDVAVGDFDGDGRQDAAAAVESGILIFRGNGDGTLSAPVEIAGSPQERLLAVDFDADRHSDLVAWHQSRKAIWILRGSSRGLVSDTSYALGATVSDIKVGDLNADGALDLLATAGARVELILGTKAGRFGIPQFAVAEAAGGWLALADLNGDRRLDLACLGTPFERGTWMTIALGFGTGGFQTPTRVWLPFRTLAAGPLVSAEMTSDGRMDLAYASEDVSGPYPLHVLKVQPGLGNGALGPEITTAVAGYVSRMMARDLDHDGKADLLLASGSQVMSYMGKGNGTFAQGETAATPSPIAGFALADLDGDGLDDLVAGTNAPYDAGPDHDDLVVIRGRVGLAPVARCKDVVVEAGAGCVAQADLDDGSSDPDGDAITLSQSPAGPYPLGVTRVTLTCADGHGAPSTCSATVTVVDAAPPSLSLVADPAVLWPPNHQLVPVRVVARTRDGCDEDPSVTLESIVSSDPDPDHEDIRGAAVGTADLTFELRAEQENKRPDRSYTICYTARDGAGNQTHECTVVRVQHDVRARGEGTEVFLETPGPARTFEAALGAPSGRGLIGLRYSIPTDGHVRVSIYDVAGHRVARPVDDVQTAGWHQASFAGGNASQFLFYRIEWDGRVLSGSIPFLR